jgi:hypothetical protein
LATIFSPRDLVKVTVTSSLDDDPGNVWTNLRGCRLTAGLANLVAEDLAKVRTVWMAKILLTNDIFRIPVQEGS